MQNREKTALTKIKKFIASSNYSPEMNIILVFGAHHKFVEAQKERNLHLEIPSIFCEEPLKTK